MSIERVVRIGDIVDSRLEACRNQGGDALQSEPDQPIIDRRSIGRAGLTDMRLGALRAGGDIKQERLSTIARSAGTGDLVQRSFFLISSVAFEMIRLGESKRHVGASPHRERLSRCDVDDEVIAPAWIECIRKPTEPAIRVAAIWGASLPVS